MSAERCAPEPRRERQRQREAAGQGSPPSPAHGPGGLEDILSEEDEQDRVPLQKLKLLGNSGGMSSAWSCSLSLKALKAGFLPWKVW